MIFKLINKNRKMKQLLFLYLLLLSILSCKTPKGQYVCPPCDLPCDTLFFGQAGICPNCNMTLIKESDLRLEFNLLVNEVSLNTGSGVFLIEGAAHRKEKTIKVYYHKPEAFSSETNILMVIPGAGRNGDSYRDAWVEASERHNVLILSPMFEEENYPFEDYHLCGLMEELNLEESISFSENSNQVTLEEEALTYSINKNSEEWLFQDFDRIFDLVIQSLGTSQSTYDLFGHSAGGQILHRLALFANNTKADRIIAANSGFYTLPDFETQLPFGLKSTSIDQEDLKAAFSKKLILLIGELDNERENGGTLLRSTTVDKQGTHRLARGKYFHTFSKDKAKELNATFNWEIEIVPNVGHEHGLMGKAAAKMLYGLD